MKKIIIIGFISIYSLLAQASLQVTVSPSRISQDTQATLTITQDNPKTDALPDLSGLQKDFSILSTQRQITFAMVNGQAHSTKLWVIELQPKRTGTLIIPPISLGKEKSTALSLQVTDSAQAPLQALPSAEARGMRLTTEVNKQSPFLKEAVTYTVKLYNSRPLLDADYQGPEILDALVVPLGEVKRHQEIQNGTPYVVEEQQYAIFPQKSGNLKIKPPVFTAVPEAFDRQKIKAVGKEQSLTVKPIPEPYVGSNWLPAKQVSLFQRYEASEGSLSQGSTLVRNIQIEGVALPAQLLPALPVESGKDYRVYIEKGKEHNALRQGELVGIREIKITYLFNKPGPITIPALELPWFNTQTGKKERAVLPPRHMKIKPSKEEARSKAAVSEVKAQPTPVAEQPLPKQSNAPWYWAAAFAFMWLLTLNLWFFQRRRPRGLSEKKAQAALKAACNSNDPLLAKNALLQWGAAHWPKASIVHVQDLVLLAQHEPFTKAVQALMEALYNTRTRTQWQGKALSQSVETLLRIQPTKKSEKAPLPSMNP